MEGSRYRPSRRCLETPLHCPRLNLLIVVVLNSDRIRQYLDAFYRINDYRLVLLVVESYVDDIFDWEMAPTEVWIRGFFQACCNCS